MVRSVIQNIVDTQMDFIDRDDVLDFYDPDKCPKHFLPYLSLHLHADTFSDGYLSDRYDRDSIRTADKINRFRGTQIAVETFCENLGIACAIERIRSGDPERVTELRICVDTFTADGVSVEQFIKENLRNLIPFVSVDVVLRLCVPIRAELYIGAAQHSYELWVSEG